MKKLIKKYLKKHLTPHPKHYHFLRWLAEFVMDKESLKDVCYSIANWMYVKNEYSLNFQYTDILVIDNIVYIYTMRPGLWIGRGGKTINSCQYHINHDIDNHKIHDYSIYLIENTNDSYAITQKALGYYANNY